MSSSEGPLEQKGPEGRRLSDEEAAPEALQAFLRTPGVKLFSSTACPFATRVNWLVEELGVSGVDYIHVDLGPAKPAWFKEHVNPMGTLPAVWVDGQQVLESMVIVEWLLHRYAVSTGSASTILPTDPAEYAAVRQAVALLGDKCIAPGYAFLRNAEPELEAAKRDKFAEAMLFAEKTYADHASDGPFFTGGTLSLVEIAYMPFLYRFAHVVKANKGFDFMQELNVPHLRNALAACMERPAYQRINREPEFFVRFYAGLRGQPTPWYKKHSAALTSAATAVAAATVTATAILLSQRR